VPFIAEESYDVGKHRAVPGRFLLVDPLDGTREFLAGETDFTVNIALIEAGVPIVGAICAPARRDVYVAGATAYRAEIEPGRDFPALDTLTAIRTSVPGPIVRTVVSRSHLDARTDAWVRRLPRHEQRAAGSSLKFCLIARGDADVYPRLAPTMEWDTAAGHAILTAAGGAVLALDGSPLRYGKLDAGFRNDGFIAWGRAPGG
jgi:3'(2'), 5'-bisphosphate nucleotidase